MSTAQMHKRLEEMHLFFSEKQADFCAALAQHHGQFTPEDYSEFDILIEQIKEYASRQINAFFDKKIRERTDIYEEEIDAFTAEGEGATESIRLFGQQLEKDTIGLKQTQERKEALLQHFSYKFSRNVTFKKCWKALLNNLKHNQQQKQQNARMKAVYSKNLMKKAFFPWRQLTYRQGFAGRVGSQTQQEKTSIHQQYQSIVDILKNKISEVDDIIKLKKAAKGEFAYALSKNLLKTISNLSIEVMSLNQMTLRDGEVPQGDTKAFMGQVDNMVQQKLKEINSYKESLSTLRGKQGEKKKKITFQ